MKSKFFPLLSIFFILFSFSKIAFASEPLVKYRTFFVTDPATGIRAVEKSDYAKNGIAGQQSFGNTLEKAVALDPNSPEVGFKDDCYPDDPLNPEGNIVISGRIISNFNNKPVSGAVVGIYMGNEQLDNLVAGYSFPDNPKFISGGKDSKGRLTNLYTYDISKDGYYRVYACNSYKQLSDQRKQVLKKYAPNLFDNVPCNVDGYVGDNKECQFFDFAKAFPKFTLAVVCGLNNISGTTTPAPQIGEILSIDNYNADYKSANPPSYMYKNNLDIRVNCESTIQAFPVPTNLDYRSGNVASCRMDDISPDLRNYYTQVQSPLLNDFKKIEEYSAPGSTLFPDDSKLTCNNPDDIFCLKNFLTKSFPKPENGKNIYDYGNKSYLDANSVNSDLVNKSFVYALPKENIHSDLSDQEAIEDDFIARVKGGPGATEGQLDAKKDVKSFISDYSFDLNVLKDLYACFTTFNAPATRSSAINDDLKLSRILNNTSAIKKEFYENNLRIPTCRELYCGSEFVPDNNICKVKKPEVNKQEALGINYSNTEYNDAYYQINALSGYGPGVTLNFKSLEDITKELLILSKELINSDFNPKKTIPGMTLNYKPVSKVSEIVACLDDDENPVYLNEGLGKKEGSITYKYGNQEKTFYSPVPLMSFISVPYYMQLFHSIEGDNYANKKTSLPSTKLLFPEQCNPDSVVSGAFDNEGNKTQGFADCRKAIIPGGVYSISALKVIARYCNEVFKIPTPDSANLPMGQPLTSVKKDSWTQNINSNFNSKELDLSITKIGTPLSLCLCSLDDQNCNNSSKLNNKTNINDFAISSFVGNGDQGQDTSPARLYYNTLGFRCNNKFKPPTVDNPKDPENDCQKQINNAANKGWKVFNTADGNFIGGNNNISVQWNFSFNELGTDDAYKYLTYNYTGNEAPKPGTYNSYVLASPTSSTWNQTTLSNDIDKGTVPCQIGERKYSPEEYDKNGKLITERYNPETKKMEPVPSKIVCIKPKEINEKGIGLTRTTKQVSSLDVFGVFNNPYNPKTQIPLITKLDESAGEGKNYVSPEVMVLQDTKDGTVGDIKTRFKIRNAKYDPIPDVLSDFKRYSVFGIFAGDSCKTPKMGSNVDIKVGDFEYYDKNKEIGDGSLDDTSYTRSVLCNAYIPEELDRCKDLKNLPQFLFDRATANRTSVEEECRAWKCQNFCTNLTGTFHFSDFYVDRNVKDPTRPNYFCRNANPLKGVEMQVNKNDEGCVYDFVTRIKQNYANPVEINQYNSVAADPRYDKSNYPVYDSRLCGNPSAIDPLNPSLEFDGNNCYLNVYKQTQTFRDTLKTQGTINPDIKP